MSDMINIFGDEPTLALPPNPQFSPANAFDLPYLIETAHTRRITDLCAALQQTRTMGLLVGLPGVGKTWAVQHAAQQQHQPELILASPVLYTSVDVENTPRTLMFNILTCLGPDYRAPVPDMISMACCWIHRRQVALIILDEAERLDKKSQEVIQDIYDRTRCAFLFIGEFDLVHMFRRNSDLHNRIGVTLEIPQLTFDEMDHFLHDWLEVRSRDRHFSHPLGELFIAQEERIGEDWILLKEIYRITQGNLRRLCFLIQESERIAQVNRQPYVQLAVLQAAARLLNGTAR
ncbi:MAG: AAA family ATPase [Chloroflexota bacterium]